MYVEPYSYLFCEALSDPIFLSFLLFIDIPIETWAQKINKSALPKSCKEKGKKPGWTAEKYPREERNISEVWKTRSLSSKVVCYIVCKWRQILYSEMKGSLILSTRWAWKLHSDRILEKIKLCYVVFLFYKHSLLYIYFLFFFIRGNLLLKNVFCRTR